MNTVTKDLVPQTVYQPGDVVNGYVLVKSDNALTWVPLNAPVNAPRPVATVTTTSGTISGRPTLTRIILAICTCGLSLLFTGVRRKNKVRTTSTTQGIG